MSDESTLPADGAALARRNLMRTGALALGAAGAAMAVNTINAGKAHAADGDPLVAGEANTATSGTSLTQNSGSEAALTLSNGSGAALNLAPNGTDPGVLTTGDLIGRPDGPRAVVDYGDGPELTYLATAIDVPYTTYSFTPSRVMDTRRTEWRQNVIDSSTGTWWDSAGRLKSGAWIDVGLADDDGELVLDGAFINLACLDAPVAGWASILPPGSDTPPRTSSINYPVKAAIANFTFSAPAVVDGVWCVRVYSSKAVHIFMDLTGVVGYLPPAPAAARGAQVINRGPKARQAARDRFVNNIRSVD